MIRDRGKNKKWLGFFFPEHVKMLKDVQYDYGKSPRPLLDESQIEEMEQFLTDSLANQTILEITTWKDGYFNTRIGLVKKIDPQTKKILIQDELDSLITIDFFHFTNVTIK
ncbi:MAG: YolD-like family protein [Bacillota bacterium]